MQKLPALALTCAFSALLAVCCCSQQAPATTEKQPNRPLDSLPYDLNKPMSNFSLPAEELRELSGLSPTDSNGILLGIADERGEIYFIDASKGGAVTRRILFRDKGDFEGVELVGQTIWALKSSGDLFAITDWNNIPPTVEQYKTFLKKSDDLEGLAYDPRRNALLLACKDDPNSSVDRRIYAFNLETRVLEENPVYQISPVSVNQYVPYTDNEKRDYFSPSGVAIHPITNDVYVISTSLKRIVVLDYGTGRIKSVERLNKKMMPQPEGISFDKDGSLYIGSEGKEGLGRLLKFEFKGSAN